MLNSVQRKKDLKLDLEIENLQQQKEINSLKKEVMSLRLKGFLDFDFSHM